MSISINYHCPEFDSPRNFNGEINYIMGTIKRWMKETGVETDFKDNMLHAEPWSKDICCVGKVALTLVVSDDDDGLLVNASAYIIVNLLDMGKHTIKTCGIDAKNLYPEIEDVLVDTLKFVYTKRPTKTYVNPHQPMC